MRLPSLLLLGLLLISIPAARADDAEGGARTYKIGPATQIQLDAVEATAAQLKTGLHATVTEDDLQPGSAATIDAHTLSAQGGAPQGGAKAAGGKTAGAKTPAKGAPKAPAAIVSKHWTITAVSADSITIEYK